MKKTISNMKTKNDIARYLRHEMDVAERERFEQQLANDPLLAEGLEGLRQWQEQADSPRPVEALDAELGQLVDELLPPRKRPAKKRQHPGRRLLLAAACLLGLLFLGYRFWPAPNPEQYYAHYFRPLTHPDMTLRGGSDSSQANYAVKAYETENYKQAIYHYRKLLDEQPGEEKHRLFLGIAYLANYQPEKAVEILSAPFGVRTEFEDDRQWYLALAYLRINNFAAAKALLNGLANGTSYYREMAGELSNKLD